MSSAHAHDARALARGAHARHARVRVWDVPVRLGHWLMAGSFALAWLTAEAERLRQVHVLSGYVFAAVIAFRLVWGVVGTRHARFASFVRGPRAVLAYLRGLMSFDPPHTTGHNPAGALAIVALLVLGALTAASGLLNYLDLGGDVFEELHEAAAEAALAVVVLHLAGVLAGSLAHRENLVAAMFTGFKSGAPDEAIARPWRSAGVVLVLWVGLASAWLWRSFG